MTLCAICTMHVARMNMGMVEPQNQGRWFGLKTGSDGFSRFGLKTGGDNFFRFSHKADSFGFSGLGLKTGSYGLVILTSKLL
jgi:hypothetical protein